MRPNDRCQRDDFSSSFTPERATPREPDVDVSPVRNQVEERHHTGDSGGLGTPPAPNISALSDNQGNVSQESGEVQEETDFSGEANNNNYNENNMPRRSKRIPTAKRTQIPGAIRYV